MSLFNTIPESHDYVRRLVYTVLPWAVQRSRPAKRPRVVDLANVVERPEVYMNGEHYVSRYRSTRSDGTVHYDSGAAVQYLRGKYDRYDPTNEISFNKKVRTLFIMLEILVADFNAMSYNDIVSIKINMDALEEVLVRGNCRFDDEHLNLFNEANRLICQ